MPSLTHVCMWSDKGWNRITADEAARLHPGGTVSAHSGLFMCELCGQYVLLTDSTIQVRHFRHSSSEKSKDCPERTMGAGAAVTYKSGEHELPIRIQNITDKDFDLEMGFVQVPHNLLSAQLRIEIKQNHYGAQSFVYSKERLNAEGITYLSIGGIPSEKYSINVTGTTDAIYQFWPRIVQGMDPEGSVFDAASGKRLVYDSDVAVGKKYYLLKMGYIYRSHGKHVTIKEVCRKTISWRNWFLYEVMANDYDKESARFFLDYHCRLTEKPIEIQTVWPVYVEGSYLVRHNQKNVVMHVVGNAPTTNVFPDTSVRKYSCQEGYVLVISCNARQQLISAGRTKALQYTYFWQEPLNQITKKPEAKVTDLYDNVIPEGVLNVLPDKQILRISIPFDGILKIRVEGFTVDKRAIYANTPLEIDKVTWGMELQVNIGLDCAWKCIFSKKEERQEKNDEIQLLNHLQKHAGGQIEVPHTLGSLAASLSGYPEIRMWLYRCIRTGYMSEQAYRELQQWVLSDSLREEGQGK